jgi:hypothetical protein
MYVNKDELGHIKIFFSKIHRFFVLKKSDFPIRYNYFGSVSDLAKNARSGCTTPQSTPSQSPQGVFSNLLPTSDVLERLEIRYKREKKMQ